MSKIQVNEIVNHFDTGAPDCPKGLTVTGFTTFSGSVSIGGTLTYEDVTNIDSVGLSTFQNGIHVTGGDVGIGTDSPGQRLEVAYTSDDDGFVVNNINRGGKFKFATSGSTGENFDVQRFDSANSTFRRYLLLGPDQFAVSTGSVTESTERLRVTSVGDVGIGTATPGAKLEVFDNTSNTILNVKSGDAGAVLNLIDDSARSSIEQNGTTLRISSDTGAEDASSDIRLQVDGSTKMLVDSSGRVGINTISFADTATALNIKNGATGSEHTFFDIECDNNETCRVRFSENGSTYPGEVRYVHSDNSMRFFTNSSEQMRSTSGGALLIGKTETNAEGAGHELRQGTSAQHIMGKTFSGTVNGIYFAHNTSYVGGLNYTNTATSLATSSDYRLKENVVNIPNAIEKAKQLNPVQFNFISDPDETIMGFIAHEVGEVVPEACFGEKDAVDEDGAIKPQSVSKANLVPLLAAALKEAISEIETLKTKVAALEGNW